VVVGTDETAAVRFRLHCGVVWLLSNDRTDEEENMYAAAGIGGLARFSYSPYAIRLVLW